MWWFIGIIALSILLFLWMIVRGAANSMDESTREMLDEEQSRYVSEYFRKKDEEKAESQKRTDE